MKLNNQLLTNEGKKLFRFVAIIMIIGYSAAIYGQLTNKAKAHPHINEGDVFVDHTPTYEILPSLEGFLTDEIQVIGCLNTLNNQTRNPNDDGTCLGFGYGRRQNIMLPPKSHLEYWRKYRPQDRQIINRFPIVNFESSFRENAGNYHAHGYVQTLKSHGIAPDIDSQLEWLRNREHHNVLRSDINRCGVYWDKPNTRDGYEAGENAVVACMYRYHHHAIDGTWYAHKAMAARDYYIQYLSK